MKIYKLLWNKYKETEENIGGPTYDLVQEWDERIFASPEVAMEYGCYGKAMNEDVVDFNIIERALIEKFEL